MKNNTFSAETQGIVFSKSSKKEDRIGPEAKDKIKLKKLGGVENPIVDDSCLNEYSEETINYYKKSMAKELNRSVDLPLEQQFRENWNWEDSWQRYELDNELQDLSYFTEMDGNDLIHLVRKMDNFFMERGISYTFIKNFEKACIAFNKLNKQ